jgi:transcriptional regulator with XRE-family HTH domain
MVDALSIPGQLCAAIQASDLTHDALAKAAGVTPDMIDRFMSGDRSTRLETVDKLAVPLRLRLK